MTSCAVMALLANFHHRCHLSRSLARRRVFQRDYRRPVHRSPVLRACRADIRNRWSNFSISLRRSASSNLMASRRRFSGIDLLAGGHGAIQIGALQFGQRMARAEIELIDLSLHIFRTPPRSSSSRVVFQFIGDDKNQSDILCKRNVSVRCPPSYRHSRVSSLLLLLFIPCQPFSKRCRDG